MYHGLVDFVCTHCGAIGLRKENHGTWNSINFGMICCNSGKAHSIIESQVVLPDNFQTLFTLDWPICKYFQKNILRFNAGLCKVSMHAKDETANRYQGGAACYRISGQVFRTIGNIQNNDDGAPHILQTYFYDNEDQAIICAGFYNGTNALENQHNTQLLWDIPQALLQCPNTYLLSFLSVNEYIQREQIQPNNLRIAIHADIRPDNAQHQRQYNLPECSEVAILMPNAVSPDET